MTDVERLLSPKADIQSDEIQVKRTAAFGQKQPLVHNLQLDFRPVGKIANL